MIPLMMQEVRRLFLPPALSGLSSNARCAQDFKPKGWLGLILVRPLLCNICGEMLS